MLETYTAKALKYLKEKGEITHLEIIRLTNTNCPYDVIRKLKKKIKLLDEWVTKKEKLVLPSGKEIEKQRKFKRFYLAPGIKFDDLRREDNIWQKL